MIRRALLLALALWCSGASAQQLGPPGPTATNAITSLTGDCAATGPGAAATTCPGRNYVAGLYYRPNNVSVSNAAGTALAANRVICTPGNVTRKATLSAIGLNVTTLAAAGNFQAAVYADANGRPGALLGNTASGSSAATGFVAPALASNVQLGPGTSPGTYLWWCVNSDNSTAAFIPVSISGGNGGFLIGSATGANLLSNGAEIAGISCAGAACNGGSSTFGTWPASLTGTTWTDVVNRTVPAPAFLVNSVP